MSACKKVGKKRSFFEINQKIQNVLKSKTTKMIVDSHCEESASFKLFAIKRNDQVKVTTMFLGFCLEKC